ncbi:TetR/AcrR family transcriptional regulator [Pendulispora rubella]|uniref:TetR/AcrR family transcriptional regulator n=1 Tax=Pendulispora rubella TaxID=2741070 RepID=A0ABZ2LP88_9BACT
MPPTARRARPARRAGDFRCAAICEKTGSESFRMTKKAKAAAVRGAPVVEAIFQATLEEIVRVGFAGLGVEEVATRAGVNKTTVYRRWPTKDALVSAALSSLPSQFGPLPHAGSFRADVLEWLAGMVRFLDTVGGQALLRVAVLEDRARGPVFSSVGAAWMAYDETRGLDAIVNRAIVRGDVPRDFDGAIFGEALRGTLMFRTLAKREAPKRATLVRLVDALLTGLLPPEKRAKTATKTRKAPAKRARAAGSARTGRRTANR